MAPIRRTTVRKRLHVLRGEFPLVTLIQQASNIPPPVRCGTHILGLITARNPKTESATAKTAAAERNPIGGDGGAESDDDDGGPGEVYSRGGGRLRAASLRDLRRRQMRRVLCGCGMCDSLFLLPPPLCLFASILLDRK